MSDRSAVEIVVPLAALAPASREATTWVSFSNAEKLHPESDENYSKMHPKFGSTGRLVAFTSYALLRPPQAPPDFSPDPQNLGDVSCSQTAYRSRRHRSHSAPVRRDPLRARVERGYNDARRWSRKRRQGTRTSPLHGGAASDGWSGTGHLPCLPARPEWCIGSGRMRPGTHTRTEPGEPVVATALVALVLAAVPGDDLRARRIDGAPAEPGAFPCDH